MKMASSYAFPLLDIKAIVSYLKDAFSDTTGIDANISERDFNSPERRNWQKYYAGILQCWVGCPPDALNQIAMTSEEVFSYPENHEDAGILMNLYQCMKVLMRTCSISDFKLSDILAPKSKRLQKLCSAFINFHRFQEERYTVYADLKEQNEALQEQREKLLEENEECKQRINVITAHQAEKEAEVQAIQVPIDEWDEKMTLAHQHVTVTQQESDKLKLRKAELNSNLARTNEQLLVVKQENSKLSAKIVPSPDRMKGEMERMERQLEAAKHSKESSYYGRLGECRKKNQLQEQRDQDADTTLRWVMAISQEKDKNKAVLATIGKTQEEISYQRQEIRQLDAKIQQLTMQISIKREKMENITMQQNMKVRDRQATMEQLQDEVTNQMQHCDEHNQKIMQLRAQIRVIQEDTEEEIADHKKNMNILKAKYHEMLAAIDFYHKRLGEVYEKHRKDLI